MTSPLLLHQQPSPASTGSRGAAASPRKDSTAGPAGCSKRTYSLAYCGMVDASSSPAPQVAVDRDGHRHTGVAVGAAVLVQQVSHGPIAEDVNEPDIVSGGFKIGVQSLDTVARLRKQGPKVVAPSVMPGEVVHEQGCGARNSLRRPRHPPAIESAKSAPARM